MSCGRQKRQPHSHADLQACGTHLGQGESERGPEDDGKKGEPADTVSNHPWEAVPWVCNGGTPYRSDGLAYDRVGDKAESDDSGVGSGNVTVN